MSQYRAYFVPRGMDPWGLCALPSCKETCNANLNDPALKAACHLFCNALSTNCVALKKKCDTETNPVHQAVCYALYGARRGGPKEPWPETDPKPTPEQPNEFNPPVPLEPETISDPPREQRYPHVLREGLRQQLMNPGGYSQNLLPPEDTPPTDVFGFPENQFNTLPDRPSVQFAPSPQVSWHVVKILDERLIEFLWSRAWSQFLIRSVLELAC